MLEEVMRLAPGSRRLIKGLLIVAASLTGTASFAGEYPPPGTAEATTQKGAPQSLSSALVKVAAASSPLDAAVAAGFRVHEGRIQVHVDCATPEDAATVVALLGTEGADTVLSRDSRVQAWVKAATLTVLASTPGVVRVRRPDYASIPPDPVVASPDLGPSSLRAGANLTAGLAAMNGQSWHASGNTGQGVKIGIIDDFAGYEALLGSDLPPAGRLEFRKIGGGPRSASPHGTACAEIVYDVAPSLEKMYLVEAATGLDVELAIDQLTAAGARIISASFGFPYSTYMDGAGFLSDELGGFRTAGGLYVNSAGNYRKVTWWGSFIDGDGDGWLDLTSSSDDELNDLILDDGRAYYYPVGREIKVAIRWSQPTAPQTDLNLYLYRYDTGASELIKVAESVDLQNGLSSQEALEFISYKTTVEGRYAVAISRESGTADVDIHLYVSTGYFDVGLQYRSSGLSLAYPADSPVVFAVAALNSVSPFALESYSSAGPTAGPGGRIEGGRRKPDISGFANVATASYGTTSLFNGTSAAAPHVAGAAAIVLSANPGWSGDQIRDFLEQRAVDMGPSGPDNDYGWGRLWLGAPMATGRRLTVSTAGTGSGAVTSTPTGISCGSACTATFVDGQWVTLVASPAAGSVFGGWSGACSGAGTCQVQLSADRSVTATFTSGGGTVVPSAEFSYSPLSPRAGETVSFTDTSSGAPTSWLWSFGDGQTSALRNPTHSFSMAAIYQVTLTASNAAGSSSRTKSISIGSPTAPTITYFSANPPAVVAGQQAILSWTSTGGTSAYIDQGVGSVPTSGSTTITPVIGVPYTLTVTGPGGSSNASVTISAVSTTSANWLLPSSARSPGTNAFWTTDLAVMNAGSQPASVTLKFLGHGSSGAAGPERTFTVPARATVTWPDVLSSVFALGTDWGPILIRSTGASLVAQGQTWTASPSGGTYGQSVPAIGPSDAIGTTPKALVGVRQDSRFRTNIALANFGDTQAVTTLQVLRPDGTTVNTRTVTVGPLGFVQLNLANDFSITNLDGGSVLLSCSPATCQVGAYASVIDAKTADPRTILPR